MQEKSAVDSASAASLKKELAARPTMSEMRSLKQQLRVLQQLEYNAEDVRFCYCHYPMLLLLLLLLLLFHRWADWTDSMVF